MSRFSTSYFNQRFVDANVQLEKRYDSIYQQVGKTNSPGHLHECLNKIVNNQENINNSWKENVKIFHDINDAYLNKCESELMQLRSLSQECCKIDDYLNNTGDVKMYKDFTRVDTIIYSNFPNELVNGNRVKLANFLLAIENNTMLDTRETIKNLENLDPESFEVYVFNLYLRKLILKLTSYLIQNENDKIEELLNIYGLSIRNNHITNNTHEIANKLVKIVTDDICQSNDVNKKEQFLELFYKIEENYFQIFKSC